MNAALGFTISGTTQPGSPGVKARQFDEAYAVAFRILVACNEGLVAQSADLRQLVMHWGPIPTDKPLGVHVAEVVLAILGDSRY